MSLLNSAMNLETLPCTSATPVPFCSVSAPAMDATTSMTSSCASANANAATRQTSSAIRAVLRAVLSAIARIDLNVLLGQVARPEARAALAFALDRKSNQAFGFVQFLLQL